MTSPIPASCLSFITGSPTWETCDVAFSQPDRSYSPETISVMTAAFDRVCQSVSEQMNENDDVKKTLERLADVALGEWTGADRSEIGDRSATG
jgi:hypothetical protein